MLRCKDNEMITKILLLLFLQITMILTAPLQMLQSLQGIVQQQMLQPFLDTQQQFPLLQQLQRVAQQQMSLQEEIQQQISLPKPIQQQIPLLRPLLGTFQQQRLALQEQMFALQQFQALQRMNLVPSSMAENTPPILVIYPNNELNERRTDFHTNSLKYRKPDEIGEDDSEIVDAEPTEESNLKTNPIRAVLLMPNTRSFIGDFISSVPFLPIEINVPDTISWIYDGIASIIAGIRQSLPFRLQPPNGETLTEDNMKSIWNKIKKKPQMPIVVMPLR